MQRTQFAVNWGRYRKLLTIMLKWLSVPEAASFSSFNYLADVSMDGKMNVFFFFFFEILLLIFVRVIVNDRNVSKFEA